jgi:choloylglycine hydrolase
MWLDETRFPSADKRPAIGVLQWIQYQLDNSATVDDVLASDKILRITTTSAPLHYLVADSDGNVATVEFLEGKMKVHKGSALPFPVLTNSTYSESKGILEARHAANTGGINNSLERFVTACNMVNKFKSNEIKDPAVDHAFNILGEVAQGSHTKWSIVYDLKKKEIHFKTLGFTPVKTVRFSAFDFSCNTPSMTYDMNQQSTGNISPDFLKFSNEINKKILDVSVEQSKGEIQISEGAKKEALDYPGTIKCNDAANKQLNNNP